MKSDDDKPHQELVTPTRRSPLAEKGSDFVHNLAERFTSKNRSLRAKSQTEEYHALADWGDARERLEKTRRRLENLDLIKDGVTLEVQTEYLEKLNRFRQAERDIHIQGVRQGAELREGIQELEHGKQGVKDARMPPKESKPESPIDRLRRRAEAETEIDEWLIRRKEDIEELRRRGTSEKECMRLMRNAEDQATAEKRKL